MQNGLIRATNQGVKFFILGANGLQPVSQHTSPHHEDRLVRRCPSPNIETRRYRNDIMYATCRAGSKVAMRSRERLVRRKLELKNNTSTTTTIWIKNAYVTSSSVRGRLTIIIIIYSRCRCTCGFGEQNRQTYLPHIFYCCCYPRYLWFWKRRDKPRFRLYSARCAYVKTTRPGRISGIHVKPGWVLGKYFVINE